MDAVRPQGVLLPDVGNGRRQGRLFAEFPPLGASGRNHLDGRQLHVVRSLGHIGIRLGITRDWSSKWYAHSKNFASNIHTDHLVRRYLLKVWLRA